MSDMHTRREAFVAAQGSLRLEGLKFSEGALLLMESWVAGEIDDEQLTRLIVQLWRRAPVDT